MKVLKKIKEMLPITNKKFKEIMTYYEDIIEGLVLSEQHHCQIEAELLQRISPTTQQTPKKEAKDNSFYQ